MPFNTQINSFEAMEVSLLSIRGLNVEYGGLQGSFTDSSIEKYLGNVLNDGG